MEPPEDDGQGLAQSNLESYWFDGGCVKSRYC